MLVYVKDTKHQQYTIHYVIQQDRKDVIIVIVFLSLVILDVFVAKHNYVQKHIIKKVEKTLYLKDKLTLQSIG